MRYFLAVGLLLLAGCALFPIEKHLVISGNNIETPYGKGEHIVITRDACFGGCCKSVLTISNTTGNVSLEPVGKIK